MLTLNDEVMALMHRSPTVASVRIGTPDDYATMLLPDVLARFNAAYPDVMVEVICDNSPDLVAEIDKGRYDLALVTRKAGEAGGELVRREPVSWVAPPQEPASPSGPPPGHRPVESLDPLPLALFPKGCVVRDLAVAALDGIGRDWRVAFTSKSVVAVHGAVMGGLGGDGDGKLHRPAKPAPHRCGRGVSGAARHRHRPAPRPRHGRPSRCACWRRHPRPCRPPDAGPPGAEPRCASAGEGSHAMTAASITAAILLGLAGAWRPSRRLGRRAPSPSAPP
ncbi:LysR substrate-binding domain-containing protein [Azospirillum sp. INR13]|uniref:LysR substrate-binding domain-containing protein n=1 Tax=Azospirillum sp. INR13 TaxID=2596919 RepID=UPI00210574A0|nr:LysR substrate-binding domain-containing protein [Azospirillum sp. INR13]